LNSQGTILITGKSQFRNYSFEVKNHCFEIHNFYGTSFPLTPTSADYCSSSCMTTYYDYLAVSNNQNSSDNNITVTPSSDNDLADYQNGISGVDEATIYLHTNNIEDITDPFKMVAADVDMDGDITTADAEMIHDLILEDIPFTRNSWEWFNSQDIYDNWGSFTSNPNSWTLSYIYSGSIYFPNVSTSLLSSSSTQPRYFYFNTTKVGELDTTSTKNDWVCGAYGFSPKSDKLLKIGNRYQSHKWAENESFELKISINTTDSLSYFQFPLNVDYNYLEIEEVITNSKFPLQYKDKVNRNKFIALFVSKNQAQSKVCYTGENLMTLRFKIKIPFENLKNVLSIDSSMIVEAGNMNFENLELVANIERPEHSNFEDKIAIEKNLIKLNHAEPVWIELRYFDLVGHIIFYKKLLLFPGDNFIKFPDIMYPIFGQVVSEFGTLQYYTRN